jgi:4-methyl-5(b-hydroxyethyl)-thiazole monophosphate biosynthesis
MPNALVLLAPGFEEIEAITVIDLLRRASIEVTTAGLVINPITGSHDIPVIADVYYKDISHDDFDLLVLPGGQPGTNNLKKDPLILEWIENRFKKGKKIAAICAAPTVLHAAGITEGIELTSYPSEEALFFRSKYLKESVVKHGTIITSRGVGTAIPFSLAIISDLQGDAMGREIADKILFNFENNS